MAIGPNYLAVSAELLVGRVDTDSIATDDKT